MMRNCISRNSCGIMPVIDHKWNFLLGWNKWQLVNKKARNLLCIKANYALKVSKVTGKGNRVTSQGMFII